MKVPSDPQKFHRYLQRLRAGYGLSASEQREWLLLAQYWIELYKEAGNPFMAGQVTRFLKTHEGGRKPSKRRSTVEDVHSQIANEVLR